MSDVPEFYTLPNEDEFRMMNAGYEAKKDRIYLNPELGEKSIDNTLLGAIITHELIHRAIEEIEGSEASSKFDNIHQGVAKWLFPSIDNFGPGVAKLFINIPEDPKILEKMRRELQYDVEYWIEEQFESMNLYEIAGWGREKRRRTINDRIKEKISNYKEGFSPYEISEAKLSKMVHELAVGLKDRIEEYLGERVGEVGEIEKWRTKRLIAEGEMNTLEWL